MQHILPVKPHTTFRASINTNASKPGTTDKQRQGQNPVKAAPHIQSEIDNQSQKQALRHTTAASPSNNRREQQKRRQRNRENKKKPPSFDGGFFHKHCLTITYFHTGNSTIIGAESFHCPVRDGKEWDQPAMVIRHNLLSVRRAEQTNPGIRKETGVIQNDISSNMQVPTTANVIGTSLTSN